MFIGSLDGFQIIKACAMNISLGFLIRPQTLQILQNIGVTFRTEGHVPVRKKKKKKNIDDN